MNIIDTREKYYYSRCEIPDGYEVYNSDWLLTPKGDMKSRLSGYEIGCDVLCRDDWMLHLMEKRWFDANTFIPAYFDACKRARQKVVRMRVGW